MITNCAPCQGNDRSIFLTAAALEQVTTTVSGSTRRANEAESEIAGVIVENAVVAMGAIETLSNGIQALMASSTRSRFRQTFWRSTLEWKLRVRETLAKDLQWWPKRFANLRNVQQPLLTRSRRL